MTTVNELMAAVVRDVEAIRHRIPTGKNGVQLHRIAANALPPPLIPAGLKLRDRRMPLDADEFTRLMDGTTTAAKWAAFQLMRRCWREVPTGTLPANEGQLREAAGLAGNYRDWKRLRPDALRPFTLCSDGRYHCHLLVEPLAAICRHRGGKRAGLFRTYARTFDRHMSDGFSDSSTTYDAARGQKPTPNVPTRLIPLTSNLESVLVPRAREADPTTPTRLQDASQDHEHEGQVETALTDNWHPSPADIEAVKAARPDLDDSGHRAPAQAVHRQGRAARPQSAEWSRRFVAFAKGGHGKPWSAPASSNGAGHGPVPHVRTASQTTSRNGAPA